MSKLTLYYDGRCGLCTRTVERLRKLKLRTEIEMIPLQQAEPSRLPPGITMERLLAQLHVVDGSGAVFAGADAVVRVLRESQGFGWLPAMYRIPGMKRAAEAVYRFIAKRRYLLFGTVDDCDSGFCSIHKKD